MTAEEQRLALAEEASSLPIHVHMCAMRHNQLIAKMEGLDQATRAKLDAQDNRLSRIEKAAWGILVTLAGGSAVTVTQLLPALQALAGQ